MDTMPTAAKTASLAAIDPWASDFSRFVMS